MLELKSLQDLAKLQILQNIECVTQSYQRTSKNEDLLALSSSATNSLNSPISILSIFENTGVSPIIELVLKEKNLLLKVANLADLFREQNSWIRGLKSSEVGNPNAL